MGFSPSLVSPQETVRNYLDGTSPPTLSGINSPMRIGDSFEDMKRKMLGYQQPSQQQQTQQQLEKTSSKPRLPSGGSKRSFSPDSELQRNLDPVPFPSLERLDHYNNFSSSQQLHQQQQQDESRPTSLSTPLRGIAINSHSHSRSNSYHLNQQSNNSDNNHNNNNHNTNNQDQDQRLSINIFATNFVCRIFEVTSGNNSNSNEQQNVIDINSGNSSENSWISNLVLSRRRSSRRVSPAPSNDQYDENISDHGCNIEDGSQNSARSRKSFEFKVLDFSITNLEPKQSTHSFKNSDNNIHQFATIFVNSILPHQ